MIRTILTSNITVAALVVAAGLLVTAQTSYATLVPLNGVPQPGPSGTTTEQPGTKVGELLAAFGPSIGGPSAFSGDLLSIAVRRTGGPTTIDGASFVQNGLDFYYQLRFNPAASQPGADIEAFNLNNFNSVGPVSAQAFLFGGNPTVEVGGPIGGPIPGLSLTNGTQVPLTVSRDSGGVLQFDFSDDMNNNRLTFGQANSVFLVVHTNDTQFTSADATFQDGGVAVGRGLVPVPEPATALVGVALLGVIGTARRRQA